MSELINNREYRQKLMKEVIRELHAGKTVDEVKEKFSKVIEGVPPSEIAAMEAQLVKEGLPIETNVINVDDCVKILSKMLSQKTGG